MSYRTGIVQKKEPGGYAQVITERKTACGECHHRKLVCYGCLLNPKIVGRVANPIGAEAGDTVKIHLSTGKLLLAAGIFYLVPIFTLLMGALLGGYVSETVEVSETASSIWGAAVGLFIGMIFVTVWGRVKRIIKMFQPVITSIVKQKRNSRH
jgi:sigma-E factor negative regulatory protein RseC